MRCPRKPCFYQPSMKSMTIIALFLAALIFNAFKLRSNISSNIIVVSKFVGVGNHSNEEYSVSLDNNTVDFFTTAGSEHPMEKIFWERRERVRDLCSTGSIYEDLNFTFSDSIDFFWNYSVSVCRMGQVASTTWQDYLLEVNNGNDTKNPKEDPRHKRMMSQPKPHVLQVIKTTTKILPVRHPLTRIVSGYLHMFKNGSTIKKNNEFFWTNFGVTAFYHAGLISPKILKEAGVTTIRHLAMSNEVYRKIVHRLKRLHITFTEFIRHLISFKKNGEIDRHWSPYTDLASPCVLDYDYIVKVETMDEETDYLFQKLDFPLETSETNALSKFRNSDDKEDTYLSFFDDVPLDVKAQLYEILRPDFEMFNYTLPKNFWSAHVS